MMNMIAKPMISWLGASKTCIESNQKHRVQQQDHSMIRLMVAVEEDSEDEEDSEALAMEKALAVVTDQSLVTTVEL